MTKMTITQDIQKEIAAKVIALMTEHGSDWTRPWASNGGGMPTNAATGKRYRGVNIMLLMMTGHSGQHWATYRQWSTMGAQVTKGQRATTIVFWKPFEKERKDGTKETFWMLRAYKVFCSDQVEGWEEPAAPVAAQAEDHTWQDCPSLEALLDAAGVEIAHGGDKAFYAPGPDRVQMPPKTSFAGTATATASECYYSTLAHEATHWTGHKSRIDRLAHKKFGDKAYAFEELVAEMGAVFLSIEHGVSVAPRPDHAQYLNSWLNALKAEPSMIMTAASAAQKATDYIAEASAEIAQAA